MTGHAIFTRTVRWMFRCDEMRANGMCGCPVHSTLYLDRLGHTAPEIPADAPPAERGARRFFSYTVHRHAGSGNHGYEDAAAVDAEHGTVAVSDGTTLGGFSGILAQALVDAFVSERFRLERDEERRLWWRLARRRWFLHVRSLYASLTASQQEKVDRGGAATFLGLRLVDEETLRVYLIGDCTLFWISGGSVTEVQGPGAFHDHPLTLNANDTDADAGFDVGDEKCLPGTMAALATDALANLLQTERTWENDPGFWERLMEMSDATFTEWTEKLKAEGRLDEDDYTLVMLRFPGVAESIPV